MDNKTQSLKHEQSFSQNYLHYQALEKAKKTTKKTVI